MTGLEKILKAIESDSKAQAETVILQAKQEAEEIMEAAKKEAEKKCAQIAENSDADVKAVISRAESAASLQERKMILDAKQQIISNIIADARNYLVKLPDSDYLEIILEMVKRHAHKKAGKILFTETDKRRLPQDFNSRLKAALSELPGASLVLAEETASIDGGFLLKYGDIEENCSFDALFDAAKEALQDRVNTLLFE